MGRFGGKSPWVLHYDGSSCNGCDIEVLACLTPRYDAERLGVVNVGNPKHADILLITGGINERNLPVVRQLYEQMPEPKVVVAIGACAASGGIFKDAYNILGGADKAVPVDVYVPGCAARPESIIEGIMLAVEKLGGK
jgi:ech hydrogenase subunit C